VCEELPHHAIFLAKNYRENLKDIEVHHRLSENPSFYVHNPCRIDPGLAPKGMSSLYVLAPVTHQSGTVVWAREKKRFRDLMLRQLREIGLDNPENRIRSETIVAPSDWQAEFNLYRGAAFSLSHSLSQLLHRRPHNRFEELEAVYLVGGGTHHGKTDGR
jgi:phytoene desaturase